MAISATYLQLQQQIAMELGDRTNLLPSSTGIWSPIKNSIQTAIAKWEREPFYFNEVYTASFFSTAAAQELYTAVTAAAIATIVEIKRLHITVSGVRYSLVQRDWDYLEDIAATATAGTPTDFAYFAQQIRLFPVPDAIRVVSFSGTGRLTALALDADTNAWTQDGFDLIKAEAKLILASEYLHDAPLALAMMAAIHGTPATEATPAREGILTMLRKETVSRAKSGIARAMGNR
jgi:hypothetical protein